MEIFINIAITTSITTLIILIAKRILKNKISPRWQFALWAIVAIRLMIPVLPESDLSIFNNVPQVQFMEQKTNDATGNLDRNISFNTNYNVQNNSTYVKETITETNTDKDFKISEIVTDNIITIWVAGGIVLLLYIIGGYIFHNLRTRKLKIVKDPEILSALDECKKRLGVISPILVREGGETPLLKGLFKPEIILPTGYTKEELKSVFMHELNHYKHRDILWNVIGSLLLCIYWYNPIVWYSFFVFKRDMEILCDYRVLEAYDDRKAYATVLLKTALNKNKFILATTCMQNGKKEITKRIKLIAYFRKPKFIWSFIAAILVMIIATGCLTNPIGQIDDQSSLKTELDYEKIYEYRTPYIGDASKVGNLTNYLYYAKYKDGFSLKTDAQPYGVTINYKLDEESNSMMYDGVVRLTDKMIKNAAMVFSLIDNVDKVNIALHDDRAIYTYPLERQLIDEILDVNTKNYSTSFDEFRNEFIPLLERQTWQNVDFEVYIPNQADIYVWRNENITGTDDIYYTILPGTNRIKDEEEVYDLEIATNSLEEVNEYLSQFKDNSHLSIRHDSSLSKAEMIELNELIAFEGHTRGIGGFGDVLENNASNDGLNAIADEVAESIRLKMSKSLNTAEMPLDVGEKVQELLQIIMSSPQTSSAPGDYIREHQNEYETILKLGDNALVYMLGEFERGNDAGLKGHIMMLLCIEILGDRNNVENLEDGTYYSPREWYSRLSPYEVVNPLS